MWKCLLAAVLFVHPLQARAWQFLNIEGKGAGTLNACAATKDYRDSFIAIRLYGDVIDMVFYHQDFALPYDKVLGPVGVGIDDAVYVAAASSFARDASDTRATTSAIQMMFEPEKFGEIFNALRNGRTMNIVFPNGDSYTVPLVGSAKALNLASECWRAKQTGPDEKNPFLVPEQSNPFQTPAAQPANPFDVPA